MPTQALFDKYPPFPNDVPIADLTRVSFAKLLAKDEAESQKLFDACRAWGFFQLDFRGCPEGDSFLRLAEKMFELNEEVNALEQEELMRYAYKPPHSLFGYKHVGNLKIEDGRPDRVEFYNVGQDDMTGVSAPLANPECIEAHRKELKSYLEQAHSIVGVVCSVLAKQLNLPPGTLDALQPLDKPSGTALRLLRYLPQPAEDRRTSLLGHTDIGSLTILFNITGGLQLLPPGADASQDSDWRYIKPAVGCAIINLGDAMVEWSAGILRSNIHRVTYAPGDQAKVPRYSHAYLLRPDGDAPMKRLAGGESLVPELEDGEEDNLMNAREWEAHKAVAIRAGRDNARSRGGRELKVKREIAV